MQESEQRAQLKRARRNATALLALMAGLFIVSTVLEPTYRHLAYLAAFAEAGIVGGLADWFAVTALFRHPFGLPIPHTAIIPRNKDRIGESLGNFLQTNFMTHEVLRDELARVDFAGSAADWLASEENSNAVALHVTEAVPAIFRMFDDHDAAEFLRRVLTGALENVKFAPVLAQVLDVLVAGRQHQVLLERILGIVDRALEKNRPLIRQKVHEKSPRWMPRAIDERLFASLLEGVRSFLVEIQGPDSEWRTRFEDATHDLIHQLATSPEYEQKLRALIGRGVDDPLFRAYLGDVWQRVKKRLLADTAAADSRLGAHAGQALRALGNALRQDAAIRDRLNDWMRVVVADTIVDRRDVIGAVVWRVIRKWDAQTVASKLELQVGKDLQYIRINGTLVGGMVGVLLHALSVAL